MKTAILAHTEDGRYVVRPADTRCIQMLPCAVFHLCLFPKDIVDEDTGLLKPNSIIETVRMENGFLYPNHKIYKPLGDKLRVPRSESREVEFKASFWMPASGSGDRAEQVNEIAAAVAGFSNSRINGTLYVGVRDDGSVSDNVENEVGEMGTTEFETDYRNRLAQVLSSTTFAAKYLCFHWERSHGRLYCRIEVTPFSHILCLRGNNIFIRSEAAATLSLHNEDLVSFIKGWQA